MTAIANDADVRLALYRHFAERGSAPAPEDIAARLDLSREAVVESLRRLRAARTLFLESDGETIRMAAPFSGVPTPHRVTVGKVRYYANCAWDALGIPAALRRPGTIHSRCEETREPLELEVGPEGPGPSSWIFHSLVPASKWWDDLVFT